MTRVATLAAASKKEGGFATRRLLAALFSVALLMGVFPAAVSAHSTDDDLKISITKAPIAPDGTTAGAPLDFVVSFADPNPAVDGVGMKLGGTITVELDEAFDLTGNQGFSPAGSPQPAILLQGWPQSPRVAPFPYTTDIDGNTITLTLTDDWAVGEFGPGPKAVHLALFASTNPGAGRYDVEVEIQPDPTSSGTLEGEGHVRIIPNVRPSVNVVSLFSGIPGPPPLFNPLYQDVTLGMSGKPVGMYLWERGGGPAVGVDLDMVNARHGHLVKDGRTVGQVWIRAPHGARNQTLTSTGPSVEEPAFVTDIPTGRIITVFTPDPAVAGNYKVTFRMNGGNKQVLRYQVSD